MTRRFKGSVVSEGFASGPVQLVTSGEIRVREGHVDPTEVEREQQRFAKALGVARRDLLALESSARSQLGELTQVVHSLLAFLDDDVAVIAPIRRLIAEELWDAPSAVTRCFRALVAQFKALPEPLPSRVPDLVDVERRILAGLSGGVFPANLGRLQRKVIIVAEDLTPTQTATLDREKVLAFVTDRGGPGSHTAILARHLGIPAVVGVGGLSRVANQGDQILVDAMMGEVVLDPDPETTRLFRSRSSRRVSKAKTFRLDSLPAVTRDQQRITLCANIDTGMQARELREMGVPGVGLFRTEYLYLGKADAPDEEYQVSHYRTLFETMAPHPVTVRTFDFGADKFDHRLGIPPEPNPFLGLRSLRLCFERPGFFRSQLRALLRAAVAGNVRIMFPMVADLQDFRRARTLLEEVRADLVREGVPHAAHVPVGAMVELPSAALTAPNLLREADFVSIGTNDLTQYTLAVDRTNSHVAHLFQPHHPAVLRLIKMTIDAALRAKKPVSACGEMAGSPRYVPVLLGFGLTEFSMAATRSLEVTERIRALRVDECQELALAMVSSDG